jgi:signal transduction histidine kinase
VGESDEDDGTDLEIEEIPIAPEALRTEENEVRYEYMVEQPIGEFGTLRIGIDSEDLQRRIGTLRGDLIRQAVTLGAITGALLVASFLLVTSLLRRSQRLEEKAAESERMAYIGTLASGLAHEIRNPLNSVNLNMQMLEEELGETGGTPTGTRLLSITRSEVGRLERLVTDFLSYAKPRTPDLEELPALELLEQAREILAGEAAAHRVSLSVVDRTGGALLRVDPSQIRQLLLNLAQNAIAAAQAAADPLVVLSAETEGQWIVLEVEDNGRGIPPEERERVFEIFYSTRKGGTGLGLAIVDRIARNHDGRVDLREGEMGGALFRVLLPPNGPATS